MTTRKLIEMMSEERSARLFPVLNSDNSEVRAASAPLFTSGCSKVFANPPLEALAVLREQEDERNAVFRPT